MSINFKNEEEKKESIIASVHELKNDIGWKVIVKALEENIKQAEARLHGDIKLEENETIELWQKIREDRLGMIDLPNTIIKENEKRGDFDPNLDPYD